MDWVEELRKRQFQEEPRRTRLDELKESGLLRKIEQGREEFERKNGKCFIIRARGYFYQISSDGLFFCLSAEKDGCYLSFSDLPPKWEKIHPERITDDQVRKWFDHMVTNQRSASVA